MDVTLLAYGPLGWGDELLAGLWLTLALSVSSYGLGITLGILCGLVELRRGVVPRLFTAYAAVMRSLPELLVILFVFFALAAILNAGLATLRIPLNVTLGPFAAGVIALSVVIGAYASEVAKGAVLAIPAGMGEAARALGLRRSQALVTVILPLAARHAFPGLANLWMVVIKTTPFVSAIQLEEFIRAAGTAGQNTKHYFLFYGIAIIGYLIISGLSMWGQHLIETRLFRHMPKAVRR
jgi:polar amino acid transport system permease protein